MRRVVAVALAVALALPAVGVGAAHGNDIEVDSQVSADGTVLVENALLVVDGFLVVHRDAGGEPGEAIGHTALPGDAATGLSVRVPVDDAAWADWGDNRTVQVVVHRDEGAEGFDPGEDPMERSFGSITAERIRLGKADNETSVVAEGFSVQRTSTDAVTVRRVALGRDGLVVVRPETPDSDGPVVGATALRAGVHENVTVEVDGSVFESRGRRLTLVAQLYAGDGPTVDDGDRPVRVGGEPIETAFTVERTGPLDGSGPGTGTAAAGTADRTTTAAVVTPSPTPTRTATAETGTGDGRTVTGNGPAGEATGGGDGDGSGASGPGLGGPVAVTAVLATIGALGLARRRGS